jgi:hypothetical protein
MRFGMNILKEIKMKTIKTKTTEYRAYKSKEKILGITPVGPVDNPEARRHEIVIANRLSSRGVLIYCR